MTDNISQRKLPLDNIKMLIPIRCFSCNACVGNKYETYQALLAEGKTQKEALDMMKIRRFCCRRMLLSHVEIIDKLISYAEDTKTETRGKTELKNNQ